MTLSATAAMICPSPQRGARTRCPACRKHTGSLSGNGKSECFNYSVQIKIDGQVESHAPLRKAMVPINHKQINLAFLEGGNEITIGQVFWRGENKSRVG